MSRYPCGTTSTSRRSRCDGTPSAAERTARSTWRRRALPSRPQSCSSDSTLGVGKEIGIKVDYFIVAIRLISCLNQIKYLDGAMMGFSELRQEEKELGHQTREKTLIHIYLLSARRFRVWKSPRPRRRRRRWRRALQSTRFCPRESTTRQP